MPKQKPIPAEILKKIKGGGDSFYMEKALTEEAYDSLPSAMIIPNYSYKDNKEYIPDIQDFAVYEKVNDYRHDYGHMIYRMDYNFRKYIEGDLWSYEYNVSYNPQTKERKFQTGSVPDLGRYLKTYAVVERDRSSGLVKFDKDTEKLKEYLDKIVMKQRRLKVEALHQRGKGLETDMKKYKYPNGFIHIDFEKGSIPNPLNKNSEDNEPEDRDEHDDGEDGSRGGSLLGNLGDKVKGTFKDTFNKVKDITQKVISGRNDYSPSAKRIIEKYGDQPVQGIVLHRKVLKKIFTSILSVWTRGETAKRIAEEPKDKLFHISIWVKLPNATILLEKNEVITMTLNPKIDEHEETQDAPTPSNTTFKELLDKAQAEMGDRYFTYSAKDNNCGNYIEGVLKANGVNNDKTHEFIGQDAKKILAGFPALRKVMNTLTDIAGRANVLLEGGGVEDTPEPPEPAAADNHTAIDTNLRRLYPNLTQAERFEMRNMLLEQQETEAAAGNNNFDITDIVLGHAEAGDSQLFAFLDSVANMIGLMREPTQTDLQPEKTHPRGRGLRGGNLTDQEIISAFIAGIDNPMVSLTPTQRNKILNNFKSQPPVFWKLFLGISSMTPTQAKSKIKEYVFEEWLSNLPFIPPPPTQLPRTPLKPAKGAGLRGGDLTDQQIIQAFTLAIQALSQNNQRKKEHFLRIFKSHPPSHWRRVVGIERMSRNEAEWTIFGYIEDNWIPNNPQPLPIQNMANEMLEEEENQGNGLSGGMVEEDEDDEDIIYTYDEILAQLRYLLTEWMDLEPTPAYIVRLYDFLEGQHEDDYLLDFHELFETEDNGNPYMGGHIYDLINQYIEDNPVEDDSDSDISSVSSGSSGSDQEEEEPEPEPQNLMVDFFQEPDTPPHKRHRGGDHHGTGMFDHISRMNRGQGLIMSWRNLPAPTEGGRLKRTEYPDWEDLNWGSFTKQFKRYNQTNRPIDTLETFARMIVRNPENFKMTTIKRALFYLNVILKKKISR